MSACFFCGKDGEKRTDDKVRVPLPLGPAGSLFPAFACILPFVAV